MEPRGTGAFEAADYIVFESREKNSGEKIDRRARHRGARGGAGSAA